MNVQEFDTALSDLETRVDRLRALYENWFRGYEKMEPAVARKDVERRVYALRKELPRNTALRFRYHQLYQRYTTLATYWQRTARQIEEGTYRLQLQRMKRRRVDDDLMRTNIPPPNGDDKDTLPPPMYELNLDETLDVQRLLDEVDVEQVGRALDGSGPARVSGSSLRPARPASPTPASLAAPAKPAPVVSIPPNAAVPSAPQIASARFSRPNVANDVAPRAVPVATEVRPPASPLPQVIPAAAAQAGPPVAPKPPPLKIPVPGAPGTGTMPALPVPRMSVKPPSAPGTGSVPLPPPPSSGQARPPVPPPLSEGTLRRAPAPPPAVPRPAAAAPVAASPAQRPASPAPVAGAPGSRPALPAHLATPAPRPATPIPAAAPPAAGLSDQKLRRIYDEYAAARRKNNEGDVRYETLAGTIQKMLPDLSKKHQGKQIDFEVVLKDGRVGLKPKAT